MGTLTAAAAVAVGAGLYFADGVHDFASALQTESRAVPPPRTESRDSQVDGPPILIGRWEDRIGTSWSQEIRIAAHAGRIVRETILPGGRVDRGILTEVTPHGDERRRFENPSSTRGQAYAITRHGHLAVFDDDGFVHQATKVSTSGEQR